MTFTYRVLLKPNDICFKKKIIPSSFDNGIQLRETLQQLLNDEILVEDIPTIDVVWCKEKWVWYTLNNRRLWVLRELEKKGKCQYIATKRVETIEHVTDFLLYGSAELIDESSSVSWDSEDGLKITTFNEANLEKESTVGQRKETAAVNANTKKENDHLQNQREWRERTPLTIRVSWNQGDKQGEKKNNRSFVQPESLITTESDNIKRERKDSGFSEASSGKSEEKSRVCDEDTDMESEEEAESSTGNQSHRQRFNKFQRYRPYSRPESSGSSSEGKEKVSRKHRTRQSLNKPSSRQSALRRTMGPVIAQRKGVYDRWLFTLHHGGKPRNEQHALKTKLMNSCGFCYKSFRAGVSLSQHVEELQHWACIRCGKYFRSYTALGQHKLSLDHCNV